MPRKAVWVGEKLWDLYHLSVSQLYKKYPDYSKGTLKGKKHYWTNKINSGEVKMPPTPEKKPDNLEVTEYEKDGHLVSEIEGWWEVVTANPEDPENPVVTRLHKHSTKKRPLVEEKFDDWQPATPANITFIEQEAPERDHRVYFVFGDAQIGYRRLDDNSLLPLHDERAMRVARLICKDLQPDEIVNLGDHVDFSELSRFSPDSDHFHRTIGPSIQRAHDYYAELRADNPNAVIAEVSSNHEIRLRNMVMKHMPQLYGMKRPGEVIPMMTYPYLVNLAHVNVEWIGGYEAAEYEIGGNPDLIARHGRETSSNGTTASKIMKNFPETNNIHGHSHEMSMATKTMRDGRILSSIAVGALCDIKGVVPGYHSAVNDNNMPVHRQQNWQQSILAVYDYGNGHYQFDNIPIINGRAYYGGKEYTA